MPKNIRITKPTRKKNRVKRPYSYKTNTTGNICLNIGRFNQAMGTADGGLCSGGVHGTGSLTESKRYVRRYYIRPQNIFCSNKAEIIKTLIDLDNANCSVYTLNNLGDDKDVTKLTTGDIIYYYDDGILYDKNKVKVMDYDLSIKKEENRKQFANIDKASEKEFKSEYEDRMTDVTELEEEIVYTDNPFDLTFEDYNVFGEKLDNICCICGEPIVGYGNNPEPVKPYSEGRCCDSCNIRFVINARIAQLNRQRNRTRGE